MLGTSGEVVMEDFSVFHFQVFSVSPADPKYWSAGEALENPGFIRLLQLPREGGVMAKFGPGRGVRAFPAYILKKSLS